MSETRLFEDRERVIVVARFMPDAGKIDRCNPRPRIFFADLFVRIEQ